MGCAWSNSRKSVSDQARRLRRSLTFGITSKQSNRVVRRFRETVKRSGYAAELVTESCLKGEQAQTPWDLLVMRRDHLAVRRLLAP